MAARTDPIRRSAMMRPALWRLAGALAALAALWLGILWAVSLP